jgi:hypothetical protein
MHPADGASVSGRSQPRPGAVIHAVRIRAAVITSDSPIVQTMKPVLQFSCAGCGFAAALDDPGGYSWPDIRDKIMRAHETGLPS